tara:strand:- start:503 stop:982 length:480 start_codon:yes stop_codon:yes gene_type:complete
MSDFNYQKYLKNNPLLQEEVKEEKLLTESQEIDETVEETVEETTEEIQEESPSSKMKVSELKAKIKETILSELTLDEADEDEVDIEDEIEVDDTEIEVDSEEPPVDVAPEGAGLSSDEQEIQNSLKMAYDNAVAIGDQKLADQIGNSITFFTRTHVVER